jgi:hypothetical protein
MQCVARTDATDGKEYWSWKESKGEKEVKEWKRCERCETNMRKMLALN